MQTILLPICLLFAWATIALLFWSAWNTLRQGINTLKRLHRIPCDRCVFFTEDYRLKCTVRPIEALTEDAIDCRDFEPAPSYYSPRTNRSCTACHKSCKSKAKKELVSS